MFEYIRVSVKVRIDHVLHVCLDNDWFWRTGIWIADVLQYIGSHSKPLVD